jgi:hypothetical protein
MTTSFVFTIQSLLEVKDGKVTGPMSPLLFAREMTAQMETKYNRLARVWFQDEQILQQSEGGGLTGYDALLIGTQYKTDLLLRLWVDIGTGGLPVAKAYQSNPEILLAPIYEKSDFARKLTVAEIRQLFDHVFAHPECLAIRGI